jgi:hypothetical protein
LQNKLECFSLFNIFRFSAMIVSKTWPTKADPLTEHHYIV